MKVYIFFNAVHKVTGKTKRGYPFGDVAVLWVNTITPFIQ